MNLLEAIDDPNLFAPWFRDPATWRAWRAFTSALFGLPMDDELAAIYRQHTGRSELPQEPQSEAWLICGRRAGKSFSMSLIAVYLATFHDYRPYLQPGERATVLILATDRRQARTIFRYVSALLKEVPMLSRLVERETSDEFDLANNVTIEVGTSSFRAVRGRTIVAAIADELAFWRDETSTNPDSEILDALRPAMATIPNAMLLCASSPYARRGELWKAYKDFYGKDGAPMVWKAGTREMNPSVPQAVIDRALERDAPVARAEYLAEFRSDIEAFVTREVVEACVTPRVFERRPVPGTEYFAFVDPSGGSNDAMTLAIAHREDEHAMLDLVRERKPPFSPEAVVADFCDVMKSFGISEVTGDRYAGEWPREQFRKKGVAYNLAEKVRSDLYRDMLPLMNSGKVELLDIEALINQIVSLERRVARGGRESIDHPPNGHDDIANAVAGVLSLVGERETVTAAMFLTKRHRAA